MQRILHLNSSVRKIEYNIKDQRTNGPVNAHLRPEIYTDLLPRMVICMYITPGQGQNNPWSQSLFQIIQIQSICQLTASFVLQMTF